MGSSASSSVSSSDSPSVASRRSGTSDGRVGSSSGRTCSDGVDEPGAPAGAASTPASGSAAASDDFTPRASFSLHLASLLRSLAFSFGVFSFHVSRRGRLFRFFSRLFLRSSLSRRRAALSGESGGGRHLTSGISSRDMIGHLSHTALRRPLSRCPAAGDDSSASPSSCDGASVSSSTRAARALRLTTHENVAQAQEHCEALALVTARIRSSSRGCPSMTWKSTGWVQRALMMPTAAPTAPSHSPSLGMTVRHSPQPPPGRASSPGDTAGVEAGGSSSSGIQNPSTSRPSVLSSFFSTSSLISPSSFLSTFCFFSPSSLSFLRALAGCPSTSMTTVSCITRSPS